MTLDNLKYFVFSQTEKELKKYYDMCLLDDVDEESRLRQKSRFYALLELLEISGLESDYIKWRNEYAGEDVYF